MPIAFSFHRALGPSRESGSILVKVALASTDFGSRYSLDRACRPCLTPLQSHSDTMLLTAPSQCAKTRLDASYSIPSHRTLGLKARPPFLVDRRLIFCVSRLFQPQTLLTSIGNSRLIPSIESEEALSGFRLDAVLFCSRIPWSRVAILVFCGVCASEKRSELHTLV